MEEFKKWLKRSAALDGRSNKDVVSRVRRAAKFVKLDSKSDIEDLLHRMSKHPEFKGLSASVRSQLRRAVKLYRQFQSQTSKD